MRNEQFILVMILVVFLSFAHLFINHSDYQEAQDQAEHYCDMVNEGTWPNYKEIDCGEDNE